MFAKPKYSKTSIHVNTSTEAEHFHVKLQKMIDNKEPIEATAPIIYTARKDGVIPQYDIRADKWDIAMEARNEVERIITTKVTEAEKAEEAKKAEEGK